MEEIIKDFENRQSEIFTDIEDLEGTEEYCNGFEDGYYNAFNFVIDYLKDNEQYLKMKSYAYVMKNAKTKEAIKEIQNIAYNDEDFKDSCYNNLMYELLHILEEKFNMNFFIEKDGCYDIEKIFNQEY